MYKKNDYEEFGIFLAILGFDIMLYTHILMYHNYSQSIWFHFKLKLLS